jgi:PAS domain S-box-containing protein
MTTPSTETDATILQSMIADHEGWLIDRILLYARRQDYTRYTSTLREAWRQSIVGLSDSLSATLEKGISDLELVPETDDCGSDLTAFGVAEADLHRKRGVDLGMFLGLMKYYRQSYLDLIERKSPDRETRNRFALILRRCFDRIEIGFVTAWHTPHLNDQLADLQQANREMTNEKNKYLTIFESLQSPAAVLDEHGCLDTVNHAWSTLFGSVSTPGSDYYNDSQDTKTAQWLAPIIEQCVNGKEKETVLEQLLQTADGERFFSVKINRMLDVSEKFRGCVILLNDVTRQKRNESALRENTVWLTEMFNALEDAVFIATPRGRIVDSNTAAQRIFGYTASELKNQSTEVLHMDQVHYRAFIRHVRQAFIRGKNVAFEYMGRRKNGDAFPALINIALLRKADDTPMGIVCVLRDLTKLKEAEAAARKSDRLQGALELAGAVCHDMNQPLMALTGYTELLLMDCPEDAPHSELLNKMAKQVAKAGAITKKLMRVTRYETKTYLDQQIIDIEKASL